MTKRIFFDNLIAMDYFATSGASVLFTKHCLLQKQLAHFWFQATMSFYAI